MQSAPTQANEADELSGFVPLFRGDGSCAARGDFPGEEAARFFFRMHRAELVALGIAVKIGRNWLADRTRLRAFMLAAGRERARAALERARNPAVKLSAGQPAGG